MARQIRYALGVDVACAFAELQGYDFKLVEDKEKTVLITGDDFSLEVKETEKYDLEGIVLPNDTSFKSHYNVWSKNQAETSFIVFASKEEMPANIIKRLKEVYSVKRVLV